MDEFFKNKETLDTFLNVHNFPCPVAGVLDEPYSQQSCLYRPTSLYRLKLCPSYVAWRAGMATQLSGLSEVRLKLPALLICTLVQYAGSKPQKKFFAGESVDYFFQCLSSRLKQQNDMLCLRFTAGKSWYKELHCSLFRRRGLF
jgi:hypothetical protein